MEAISKAVAVAPSDPDLPGTGCIQRGYQLLESKFDTDYGGFGSAPKFPQPGECSGIFFSSLSRFSCLCPCSSRLLRVLFCFCEFVYYCECKIR